jgi:hypothetical protein
MQSTKMKALQEWKRKLIAPCRPCIRVRYVFFLDIINFVYQFVCELGVDIPKPTKTLFKLHRGAWSWFKSGSFLSNITAQTTFQW